MGTCTNQALISACFVQHQEERGVLVGVEARTRSTSSIVTLPDVIVIKTPPERGEITEAPLIVVEVLSPRDTYAETRRRARDYQQMGIENIWLIDPDTRTAQVCAKESWTETTRFDVAGSLIDLVMAAVFSRLDKHGPRT